MKYFKELFECMQKLKNRRLIYKISFDSLTIILR